MLDKFGLAVSVITSAGVLERIVLRLLYFACVNYTSDDHCC
jgi:hypothetical protein